MKEEKIMSEEKAKQVTTNGASEQKKQPMDREAAPKVTEKDEQARSEPERKEGSKELPWSVDDYA
jgi:hypothetical protein